MCKGIRQVWMMGFSLLLGITAAVAQLHVCPKCGYENAQGVLSCTHCQARFPGQDSAVTGGVREIVGPGTDVIAAEYIVAEMAEGQKCFAAGKYELARLFFLNALALEGVSNPQDHENRSTQLLQLVAAAGAAALQVQKRCPRCGGSGQQPVDFEGLQSGASDGTLGSGQSFSTGSGVACRKCDGTGTVLAAGTIADLKYVRGVALAEFRQYQQARRYEPLGAVWIPPHLVGGLSVRQRATVLRAIALPCEVCGGYGRTDCRHCEGRGRIDCKNCTAGRVAETASGDGVRRLGAGRLRACEICGGSGTLPCRECNEEGTLVCARCDGSGAAEVCRSCGARGYVTCRRCKGSKVYRGAPCPHCDGEGDTLCSSCNGHGRRP